tara:strand:- start:2992 stop:3996 length:1005 start_codon:yes stop_codon:yes gene_type:complete
MIWQGDVFFRRIVELTLEDLKNNDWLVDDILSDFVQDPMLSTIYGQKEIENAKKWLKENEISVLLPHRMDVEKFPCVTISIGSNTEDRALARLGDLSECVETFEASDIGRTIPYIIEPFAYESYVQLTGEIKVDTAVVDLSIVQPGMVVIDPKTGTGWVVASKTNNSIFIAAGTNLTATEIGILPQYRTFKARREIATFQERIVLGCHTHGDPNSLLWLYSFMMYGLLRYREGVLESRNFQLSNIETSDLVRNDNFQNIGENAYSRFITITGQVENTWIKAPKRVLEAVVLKDFESADGSGGDNGAGIVIFDEEGGEIPEIIDTECEPWVAKDK